MGNWDAFSKDSHTKAFIVQTQTMYHYRSGMLNRKEKRMRTVLILTVTLFQLLTISQVLHASEYLGNNQRTGYTDAAVPA